jgi:hypothetical protein
VRWMTILLAAAAVAALTSLCYAGLGKPLARQQGAGGLQKLESSEAYREAVKALEQKGYTGEQANAALAKLGPQHLSSLGGESARMQGGGLLDLLLFILLVALIVWLIVVLVEADRGYYYRRY